MAAGEGVDRVGDGPRFRLHVPCIDVGGIGFDVGVVPDLVNIHVGGSGVNHFDVAAALPMEQWEAAISARCFGRIPFEHVKRQLNGRLQLGQRLVGIRAALAQNRGLRDDCREVGFQIVLRRGCNRGVIDEGDLGLVHMQVVVNDGR